MNEKNLKSLKDRTPQERQEIARKGGRANAIRWEEIKQQRKELWEQEKAFYDKCEGSTIYKTLNHYLNDVREIVVNKPHYVGKENGYSIYSTYEIEKGKELHGLILNIIDGAKDTEDKDNAFRYTKLLTNFIKVADDSELKTKKIMLDVELKKQQLEYKKQVKLKELELKEREIAVKETLIKLKNKGIIDGVINKEQDKALTIALNQELIKAIEDEQKQ